MYSLTMNRPKILSPLRSRSVGTRRVSRVVYWGESKQQAVLAAARQVPPDVDAREALGFMPLQMKGASIRWRGL